MRRNDFVMYIIPDVVNKERVIWRKAFGLALNSSGLASKSRF